jgi:formylglycine-generating enzyme required for sulfatase activity
MMHLADEQHGEAAQVVLTYLAEYDLDDKVRQQATHVIWLDAERRSRVEAETSERARVREIEQPIVAGGLSVVGSDIEPAPEPAVEQPAVQPVPAVEHEPAPGAGMPTARERRRATSAAIVGVVIVSIAGLVAILVLVGVFGGDAAPAEEESSPEEQAVPAEEEVVTPEEAAPVTEETAPTEQPSSAKECELGYGSDCQVTANGEWTPVTETFEGVEMALVPAGCFMMGSNEGERDEIPVHEQCFNEPFWIDVYEVTNAQFGSVGCSLYSSSDSQPRNCMSWFEAETHCENRGARLPTEAEWEYAARGPDGLIYPWGDDFADDNVVYSSNSGTQTADVGSRSGGVSWVGAYDMSGNVWEWVSSIYQEYPYDTTDGREVSGSSDGSSLRGLRGGSWYDGNTLNLRAANRYRNNPDSTFYNYGYRCANSF